ncbi:MAG TPA: ABC transporter permease subunit [Polyangiaceae bacterium]|jgi:ABC-type dipeptide/oligopeptide/nickel transport system permease component
MLRHALRRLLWVVPILIGVTLASFTLLSYVPDPADDPTVLATLTPEQAVELRRSRFLDLPRIFNEHPVDLAKRASDAVDQVATGGERAAPAAALLAYLGGAALPYVLPRLDALGPAESTRVALSLSPVARRMGLETAEAADRSRAVAFWDRFWGERSIDFRAPNAYRAARRLSLRATEARESDLLELDTFALPQIMGALEELASAGDGAGDREARVTAIRRLVDAASHATERDDRVGAGATEADALACLGRWREWWLSHETDFTAYSGMSRLLSMVSETQYAKWANRVLVLGFGAGSDRSPVLERMRDRAGPTLMVLAGALALAYALVLAVASARALRGGSWIDRSVSGASLLACITPTACLATWIASHMGGGVLAGVAVLSLAIVPSPLAQLRTALLEENRRGYVTTARALGFGAARLLFRQTLREALLPIVALASVELPLALSGAFVVEKAFGLHGLGDETVRAVQTHDVAWLVGLVFVTSLTVTLASIGADLATALLDPRLSLAALRNQRIAE